jgi:hypothetical protein
MSTLTDNDGWTAVTPKYVPPHMKSGATAAASTAATLPATVAAVAQKYVAPGMRAPVIDTTPILGFAPPTASPALQAALAGAGAGAVPVNKAYLPPGQRSANQGNGGSQTFDEMFPTALGSAATAVGTVSWQGGNFLEFLKNKELAALNEAPVDNGILASHTNVLTGKTFVARDLVLEESDDDSGGYVGPKKFYERQEVRLLQQAAMRLQMLRQRYGFEEPDDGSTGSIQESNEDDEQGDFYDNNSDSNEGEDEEVYSD